MKKYVDLDAVLDVLAKDHAKRTDDQEAEILKVWDEIKKIPKANVVELPCEVGQTVYEVSGVLWLDTDQITFTEFRKRNEEGLDIAVCEKIATLEDILRWMTPQGILSKIPWGNKVFLTRQEAEKAREKMIERRKKK